MKRWLFAILIILMPPVFAAEPVVTPQPDGSLVITLSVEAVKACAEQGGCRIMSRDQLMEFIERIKPKLCNELDV